MLSKSLTALLSLLLFSTHALAQLSKCEAVLIPAETSGASSYSRTLSYMKKNAALEYAKLTNMSYDERAASTSYKLFSAEYNDSRTASEFSEKVLKRLSELNFSQSEEEAKSHYRRDLSPEQIAAWERCVVINSGTSQILLSSNEGAANAVPLRMQWWAGRNKGTGNLELSVANGKIGGKTSIVQYLSGSGEYSWFVNPDPGADKVIVIANIEGATDVLTIYKSYPVFKPTEPSAEAKAKGGVIIKTSSPLFTYTYESDGRISKTATCPDETEIVPGSGSCDREEKDKRYKTEIGNLVGSWQVGPYTWACLWDEPQPKTVGLRVEANCRSTPKPELFRQIEHVVQRFTTSATQDDRTTKQHSCPAGKTVVPGSGLCFRTAIDHPKIDRLNLNHRIVVSNGQQVGDAGWSCTYPVQPEGVGIWIEMDCGVAVK